MISTKTRYHHNLSNYFKSQPLYFDGDLHKKPNIRKCMEQPWQEIESAIYEPRADLWNLVIETLCDLSFIEAKCIAGFTYKLIDDYRNALNYIPDNQSKLLTDKKNEKKVEGWIQGIIRYSAEWNEQRDMALEGRTIIGSEPVFPDPPSCCRLWTTKEIKIENQRIVESPTRLDSLHEFYNFINQESWPLSKYNEFEGFIIQHAYNYSGQGLLHEKAKEKLATIKTSALFRTWSKEVRCNPFENSLLKTILVPNIRYICTTPDNHLALTANTDNTICVLNLDYGYCVQVLEGHHDEVTCVDLTPDGKYAVSSGKDKTIRVWDLGKGCCIRVFEGHEDEVLVVSITPDGRLLASAGKDCTVRIWDVKYNRCNYVFTGHQDSINYINFSPDGRFVFSSDINSMRVWNIDLNDCLFLLDMPLNGSTPFVAVSSNWKYAVSNGDRGNELIVWDLGKGSVFKKLKTLTGKDRFIGADLTPDGTRAVSISLKNEIYIWDIQNGSCIKRMNALTDWVYKLTISADSHYVTYCSPDQAVRVCDLEKGLHEFVVQKHTNEILDIKITPNGEYALSTSRDDTIGVWDISTETCIRMLKGHTSRINDISISSDYQYIATASSDKSVRIWNLSTGKCTQILKGHEKWVTAVSITPDGQFVVSGSTDKTVRIWNLKTGTCLFELKGHSHGIHDLEITNDSKFAISLDIDKNILVWNIIKGNLVRKLGNSKDCFTGFRLIPDSTNIITKSGMPFISIWDFINGKRLRDLSGHTDIVLCDGLTDDNRFVITSGRDKTIRIWEIQTGKCLRILTGHDDWVQFVKALPESDLAISVSYDKTLRLWDLNKCTCSTVLYLTVIKPIVAFSHSGKIIIGTGTGDLLFFEMNCDIKNHKQIELGDFYDNGFKQKIRKFADPIKKSILSLLEISLKK